MEKFKDPNYAELCNHNSVSMPRVPDLWLCTTVVEETFTNLDVVQAEDEIRKLKKATDYAVTQRLSWHPLLSVSFCPTHSTPSFDSIVTHPHVCTQRGGPVPVIGHMWYPVVDST